MKSASSFQGSLSSLLRSRSGKSGQRAAQQESPGGRANRGKTACGLQVGTGSEEVADIDGDEELHEPKREEQNIQINSPMHTQKESMLNLSQKNRNMGMKSKAEEHGDGENVDDSYHQTVEEM